MKSPSQNPSGPDDAWIAVALKTTHGPAAFAARYSAPRTVMNMANDVHTNHVFHPRQPPRWLLMPSAAKYYVIYEPDREPRRPWKVVVSTPYASGNEPTVLRRFKRKRYAVKQAKKYARNNNERVAVNRKDGATTQHYDYENE